MNPSKQAVERALLELREWYVEEVKYIKTAKGKIDGWRDFEYRKRGCPLCKLFPGSSCDFCPHSEITKHKCHRGIYGSIQNEFYKDKPRKTVLIRLMKARIAEIDEWIPMLGEFYAEAVKAMDKFNGEQK